jgi:hypothetical protein
MEAPMIIFTGKVDRHGKDDLYYLKESERCTHMEP